METLWTLKMFAPRLEAIILAKVDFSSKSFNFEF